MTEDGTTTTLNNWYVERSSLKENQFYSQLSEVERVFVNEIPTDKTLLNQLKNIFKVLTTFLTLKSLGRLGYNITKSREVERELEMKLRRICFNITQLLKCFL